MTITPASAPKRLDAVDALRGLIMMFMALDHARAFVAREHPFEIWSAPLHVYATALPFLTRLVTHLCAPGFFFLMGVGMTLLAAARTKAGWTPARITRFLATRGVILFFVEQLLENPAWVLGLAGGNHPGGPTNDFALILGVLYALSGAMIVWSVLIHQRPLAIAGISVAMILATQLLIPPQAQGGDPISVGARLLLVPGKTGYLFVLYPIIPWLGLTGLGIVFGRTLLASPDRAARRSGLLAFACLASFVGIRWNGGFGNIHVPVPAGWIGFFTVTKYPPSLAFLCLTLGVDLLLLAGLFSLPKRWLEACRPLLTFGRTALFFYLVHLYLFALIGFGFPDGAEVATVYPFWMLGLVLLFPVCARYEKFKARTDIDSLWRFF